MSRFTTVIIATIAFALLAGCGPKGLQKTSISGEPEWYRKPPVNKDFMYGAYSATSQDMQLACDKAAAGARADIGKQVEVKIQGMEKRFNEETGIGNDAQLLQQFTQATKVIVNATLQNTIIKEKITRRDGDNWRAYVLIDQVKGLTIHRRGFKP